MRLTAMLKLLPDENQAILLKNTLKMVNSACNDISAVAWTTSTFNRDSLHQLTYHNVKARFGLGAQLAIHSIGKVVDSYKISRRKQCKFRLNGAITYDSRILGYDLESQTVRIWVMGKGKSGRVKIPFTSGAYHLTLLAGQRGESDLVYRDGHFYLYATCEVDEEPLYHPENYLGVDLGIINIATDSDGRRYSGAHINNLRRRHLRLRQKLQSKGTKSTRRKLQKRARKEKRVANYINHQIAKRLVKKAKGTKRGIALEDLSGIRESVTVRYSQRRTLHAWSFANLRAKIEYKSKLLGVPLVVVDPRNTSRTCPSCGSVDRRNRVSQAKFCCISCGFSGHADAVAACNIASRAVVNQPNVSTIGNL